MHLPSVVLAAALAIGAAPLAAQDAPAPIPSPRDTARATVSGANLLVDYGRPSKRGRAIYGGLVPWGKVWRTGANAATTFVTSKPLVIGGTTVPAGTYTLYSVPKQSGPWLLVVNKQTKQWGTEYHEDQDLARIPMTTASVSPAVEKFTIEVAPEGSGGVIGLVWDTTRASVAFRVQ
ncbi:MAG TPA: DUF2911 domain-containing protein [Gemmatimonadaceae bacterium]|jgi:hypothetical protein|nr:DUF2911 domain-containing protein [Gemmatimonadaceae bacterium]